MLLWIRKGRGIHPWPGLMVVEIPHVFLVRGRWQEPKSRLTLGVWRWRSSLQSILFGIIPAVLWEMGAGEYRLPPVPFPDRDQSLPGRRSRFGRSKVANFHWNLVGLRSHRP